MPQRLIGNLPYQVPRNADLGNLAFQDNTAVKIDGGAITLSADKNQGFFQDTNISNVKPLLMMDFANSKVLDPRFTFGRSTTATYYDGVTSVKAEENLFKYSQSFVPWASSSFITQDNAAIAPDGTVTASKLIPTTTAADHSVTQQFSYPANTTYTLSCYLKQAGYSYAVLRHYNGTNGNVYAVFNLASGTTGTSSGITSSSITSVGNGWYRCVVTLTLNVAITNNSFGVAVSNNDSWNTGLVGDGVSGVYAWGAQLELRSSVTGYTPTTTSAISNYLPVILTASANTARFDHDPVTGESRGLLIEDAKTNNCLQSADFSTTWTLTRATLSSNIMVAPDGTQTADKLIADTSANSTHYVLQNTGNIAASWTFSLYAKAAEYDRIGFSYSNTGYIFFNLTTGVQEGSVGVGITGYSITHVGNGWYRCSFSSTSTATGNNIGIYLMNGAYSSGNPSFTGNSFSGVYIWGAQTEAGSYPSSYIPTTTATVSRSAEVVTSSAFAIPYSQGTVMLNYIPNADSPYHGGSIINFYSNQTGNGILVYRLTSDSTVRIYADGSYTTFYTQTVNTDTTFAFSYNKTGLIGAVKNSTTPISLSAPLPIITTLSLGGNNGTSTNNQQGWYKKLVIYSTQASSAELQEMVL